MVRQVTWAVVGAGPAGIASVGQLLDQGVDPQSIIWLDPRFTVGDLGDKWFSVSSNTSVRLFKRFLYQCHSFNIQGAPNFELFQLDPLSTCQLSQIVQPLQWVTNQLLQQVQSYQTWVEAIAQHKSQWQLHLTSLDTIQAYKVILAPGCEPKAPLFKDIPLIPLTTALDPRALSKTVSGDETIAVFGSSHSAVLILKTLVECGVKRIVNFYRHPLCYAVFYDDWILHDNTGLKGIAADWAKAYLETPATYPANLQRIVSKPTNLEVYLPQVDRAIYPIGFERRPMPIEGVVNDNYNKQTGEIASNLYGLGIAFPEVASDRVGNQEARVGLWKFMEHIEHNIKSWLTF